MMATGLRLEDRLDGAVNFSPWGLGIKPYAVTETETGLGLSKNFMVSEQCLKLKITHKNKFQTWRNKGRQGFEKKQVFGLICSDGYWT